MSAKYAQEMILIPKPSSNQDQSGGQVTPDTMDQFWQRRSARARRLGLRVRARRLEIRGFRRLSG